MNLNPSDGHIMDYTTGWDDEYDIGSVNTSFTKDYLSQTVWSMPVNWIAIVRHQKVYVTFFIARSVEISEPDLKTGPRLESLLVFKICKKKQPYLSLSMKCAKKKYLYPKSLPSFMVIV